MANIIDSTYFYGGKLKIAQASEPSVAAAIAVSIDTYEPEFLTKLFGYAMYKAYLAEVGADGRMQDLRDGKEYTNRYGVLDKWRGLKFVDGTGKRSMIANFVYYWWMRSNATATTGTGEKNIGSKNATSTDSVNKQVTAWNEMVKYVNQFWEYLYAKQDVFPEYFNNWPIIKRDSIELYKPINNGNL